MIQMPMVALSEVAKQVQRTTTPSPGTRYRQLGVKLWGEGAYERDTIDGCETKYRTLWLAKEGDIVVNKIWARNGSVAVVTKELDGCHGSSEFPTYEPNRKVLEPRWIHWLTKTRAFWAQCDEKARGTSGKNRIRPEKFLEIKCPLPPLSEQNRIVERIDALAAKIKEAKGLQLTVEQGHEALQKTIITSIVEQAPYTGRLGEVLLSPPKNGWSARCDNLDTGTAILSLGAITGFWYRPAQIKRTSLPTKADAHYWLKPGDLLISRSNTPDLVGHAAIYDGYPSPCIYPDLLMLLKVDNQRYDPRFVHYVLQTRQVRDFIRMHAKGTSPTMKKISQGVVSAIPFPTSVTRENQVRLVKQLDDLREKLDQASRLQSNTHDELNAMLPAILDRAFKGEL